MSESASDGKASPDNKASESSIALGPEDVIVGKGKGAYLYEGNRRYMQIVCRYVTKYRDCTKNADKVQITKEIVDQVTCRGGRFLGQDNRGKLYEVTEKQARVKVGQVRKQRRKKSCF